MPLFVLFLQRICNKLKLYVNAAKVTDLPRSHQVIQPHLWAPLQFPFPGVCASFSSPYLVLISYCIWSNFASWFINPFLLPTSQRNGVKEAREYLINAFVLNTYMKVYLFDDILLLYCKFNDTFMSSGTLHHHCIPRPNMVPGTQYRGW